MVIRARPLWALLLVAPFGCNSYGPDAGTCRSRQILATEQQPRFLSPEPETAFGQTPSCHVDSEGAVVLTFVSPRCNARNSWWSGCAFARDQNLQTFDLIGQGQGVLVAHVCVENLPRSTLNLRFGPPDAASKFLRIIGGDEGDFGDGCRLIYLGPEDACYGEGCGRICRPDGTGPDISASSDAGQSSSGLACTDFSRSEVVLMNEWCVDDGASRSGPTTIRLVSLSYYPSGCDCTADRACAAPAVCRRDGWRDFSKCATGRDIRNCAGICASSRGS